MDFNELQWKKFPVLSDGFVCLVDVMGDDAAIVQAARVSYGEGTKHVSDDRTLIRYLMRHRHSTPFEMAELKFLVRVPMDCWRQWIRHRTASTNEYSTRYSEAIDSMDRTPPDGWRVQSKSNKQGSGDGVVHWPSEEDRVPGVDATAYERSHSTPGEYLSEAEAYLHREARDIYEQRLRFGVAREQARKDLPLSTYSEAYWKIDLHNLLHFLGLRMDSHAQKEIRDYATTIGYEIVKPLFPAVWEAFVDYRLEGMTLSRLEVEAIRSGTLDGIANKREREECLAKVERLGVKMQWTQKDDVR